jgi:metal-sulfur cluster biosynthetic enzyme
MSATREGPPPPEPAVVYSALRGLVDPEVGLNVIDLGMVGEVVIDPLGAATVELMPTTPGCPMHDVLAAGATHIVRALPGVTSVEVRFVYDPAWTPDRISPEARHLLGMA